VKEYIMASFVEVPDVGEFAVIQELHGQQVVNVYHIKKEGGWDSASLAAMCVVLISWYNDDFAPNVSTALKFLRVKARDLTTATGAIADIAFPALSGGDDIHDALANQDSCSINHTTGRAGRSFRGRTSYSGVPDNKKVNNALDATWVGDMLDAVVALDAAIIAGGGTWGVVSRYSGYTWTEDPPYKKIPTPRDEGIFTDIIDHNCTGRIGSQDSRNN
jgi:hypothetical protein